MARERGKFCGWADLQGYLDGIEGDKPELALAGRRMMREWNGGGDAAGLMGLIDELAESQCLAYLLPFYNRVLDCVTVSPEVMVRMMDSVGEIVRDKPRRLPMAPMLKEFWVHVDGFLGEPEFEEVIRQPLLALATALVEVDKDHVCMGFQNKRLSRSEQERLVEEIGRGGCEGVIAGLESYWQCRGDFADDEMIQEMYRLWCELGEESTNGEDREGELPVGFEEAGEVFEKIKRTGRVGYGERKKLAGFYKEVMRVMGKG